VATAALFRFSPVTPGVGELVFFNASQSTPGTGRTIVEYSWDFGDGSRVKTGVTTSHDFELSGMYLVTLTVTDDRDEMTTSSQPITVHPALPPVVK
jgi:PKD repeat protein